MELAGKNVLVIGLARTGVATAKFCAARGARVTAVEQKPESELADAARELRALGVRVECGTNSSDASAAAQLVVPSPGVPEDHALLLEARRRAIPVWSEIELAYRFLSGKLIAVTGSNGKTTTTALLGHILETAKIPVLVGGNIGTPMISLVEASTDSTITVVEASSFQLELIESFCPDVAVMLNLTPDHLDRHGSFENYARAKWRIFENQSPSDAAILNADDPEIARRIPENSRVFWFSARRCVESGACVCNGEAVICASESDVPLFRQSDIPLRGIHNLENVLAASLAAYLVGAPPAAIAEGVRTFAGVEHRLEFVAEIAGVRFYNDSKATNVDATLKALESFDAPLHVILGGKDKGSDYTPLREPLHKHAREALLIGAAAQKIASQIEGAVAIQNSGDLQSAIAHAFASAQPGDVVLLAPACASFDQFENYEHRGRVFKQLVADLKQQSTVASGRKK